MLPFAAYVYSHLTVFSSFPVPAAYQLPLGMPCRLLPAPPYPRPHWTERLSSTLSPFPLLSFHRVMWLDIYALRSVHVCLALDLHSTPRVPEGGDQECFHTLRACKAHDTQLESKDCFLADVLSCPLSASAHCERRLCRPQVLSEPHGGFAVSVVLTPHRTPAYLCLRLGLTCWVLPFLHTPRCLALTSPVFIFALLTSGPPGRGPHLCSHWSRPWAPLHLPGRQPFPFHAPLVCVLTARGDIASYLRFHQTRKVNLGKVPSFLRQSCQSPKWRHFGRC